MFKGIKRRFDWIRYLFQGEEGLKKIEEDISDESAGKEEVKEAPDRAEDETGGGSRHRKKKERRGIDDTDPVSFRTATGKVTAQQAVYYVIRDLFYSAGPMFAYIGITLLCIFIGYPLSGRTAYGFDRYLKEYSNPLMAVGVVITLRHLYKVSKKRGSVFFEDASLYIKGASPKKLLLSLVFGAGAALFLSALLTLIPKVWIFAAYDDKVQRIYKRYDILLTIIESAVLTPLVEEIIFRGYMLNRLLKRWADMPALIVTTLVFSFMHGSSIWVLYAFAMGLVIGMLSMREGNIIYGIFVHAGFNLPSVIQWFVYLLHPEKQSESPATGLFRVILTLALGLAGAALSATLYRKSIYGREKI